MSIVWSHVYIYVFVSYGLCGCLCILFTIRTVQLLPINVTSSDVLTWKKICTYNTFYVEGIWLLKQLTVTAASECVVAKENLSVKCVLALYVRINNKESYYKLPHTLVIQFQSLKWISVWVITCPLKEVLLYWFQILSPTCLDHYYPHAIFCNKVGKLNYTYTSLQLAAHSHTWAHVSLAHESFLACCRPSWSWRTTKLCVCLVYFRLVNKLHHKSTVN